MKTRDKRRDSGEYYPGGRVIARPGTAPQQVVVQWSDVQGKPQIAPLPERYRESDMKGKINEIASKFATVLMAALIGWSACAGIVVQKARKDQIWNDESVVTDVVYTAEVTVDGAARPLPKYLHALDFDDSYPADAERYYVERASRPFGSCSSVRDGGFLSRNYDWTFDDAAEFVVRLSASTKRFASVGVANVGTNLTEAFVTSGKPSRYYKCLPGHTVDGINEKAVACNINVVDGPPQWGGGVSPALHPLAAIRWILDNSTNAEHAATYIAAHIAFPQGWEQNFHYMVADESSTYIVENGTAYPVSGTGVSPVHSLTNFRLYPTPSDGEGQERYVALTNGANITSQWWTLTYTQTGYRPSDLPGVTGAALTQLFDYWASKPREAHRGETFDGQPWWQSVHTSVYDLTNKTMRIAVQETDDWYVFAVPSSGGGVSPDAVREIVDPLIEDATNGTRRAAAEDAERMVTQKDAADFGTGTDPFSIVGRVTNKDVKLVVTNGCMSIVDKTNTVYTTRSIEDKAQAASEKVDRLEAIVIGSNVVFSVTNSASGKIDLSVGKLKIRENLGDPGYDSWHEVYDSRAEILAHQTNYDATVVQPGFRDLAGRVTAASNWLERTKAPVAWGEVASDGLPAPSNTVVIRAPSTVFAGGYAFERVNVGAGSICVLSSRGAAAYTGEPGTFRFRDTVTGEYFGYLKNTYTLGVHTDGIEVDGATHMVMLTYSITMSEGTYPVIKYLAGLESYDPDAWTAINDANGDPIDPLPPGVYGIAWEDSSGTPGQRICHINVGDAPKGFFCAEIGGIRGSSLFQTNMAALLEEGVVAEDEVNPDIKYQVKPYVVGENVIWKKVKVIQ